MIINSSNKGWDFCCSSTCTCEDINLALTSEKMEHSEITYLVKEISDGIKLQLLNSMARSSYSLSNQN